MSRRTVWMIGTDPEGQGGIASVVRGYVTSGFLARHGITYVVSHRNGGAVTKGTALLAALARVWGGVLFRRIGCIHVHVSYGASFWRKLLLVAPALLSGVPVIAHLHAGSFKDFYASMSGPAQAVFRWFLGRCRLTITLTQEWEQWVRSIAPDARTVVLPNSLPGTIGMTSPRSPRADGMPTVLFLGQLAQAKGTFDLVDAAGLLRERGIGVRLVFAGDGDSKALLEAARARGLGDVVHYAGWVTGAAKEALLNEATVFALPSYREGLPMVILEAMAYGLPIVTTPVGGIPTAIQDGVNGLMVAPGDVAQIATALERLLTNADLRITLGARARESFDRTFTHEANLPRLATFHGDVGALS